MLLYAYVVHQNSVLWIDLSLPYYHFSAFPIPFDLVNFKAVANLWAAWTLGPAVSVIIIVVCLVVACDHQTLIKFFTVILFCKILFRNGHTINLSCTDC